MSDEQFNALMSRLFTMSFQGAGIMFLLVVIIASHSWR